MLKVIVMAGGRGERFWPLSRQNRPKQFLPLTSERSMLQETVARVAPLVSPADVYVVTAAEYAGLVREQLPSLPPGNVLIEPVGRNTAPCIGLAAMHLVTRPAASPDDVMLVLPSDHRIADPEAFRATLQAAAAAAAPPGRLATIGIRPSRPETGYGYVEPAERVAQAGHFPIYRVRRFVEKPDAATAARFLTAGTHLWNSGMFAWRVDTIQTLLARYLPEVTEGLRQVAAAWDTPEGGAALAAVYPRLPAISIDYAVLEKATDVVVVPGEFGWDDVGSWPALARVLEADAAGNVTRGQCLTEDASGSVLYNEDGRLIAAVGVSDLVIVQTPDVVLVCPKDRSQDVRRLVEELRRRALDRYL